MKSKFGMSAKKIALIAVMTATLEVVKLALAAIPNIEGVTLLCGVYGYVFGGPALLATLLFVCIEILIWGFGSWSVAYFIHWGALCIVFWILGLKKVRNRLVLTLCAAVMTVLFGVTSSLIEIGLFSNSFDNFGYRFSVYYSRGAVFYIIQIVCNLIVYPVAFRPLSNITEKARKKYFNVDGKLN